MSNLKKKFFRDGYIYKYRAISEENAKNILREFDNNHHNHNNYLMDEMNFRPDLMFRSMHDLVYNRKISEVVKQILGPKVVSWYSLLFYKRKKKFVSFHQDLKYWQFKNENCLTVSLALSPSTLSNGCLHVIKSSHKKQFHHERSLIDKNNLLARNQVVDILKLPKPKPFVLKPGEFSVHHGNILHGSYINKTSKPRVLYAIRYASYDNPSKIYKYARFLFKNKNKNKNYLSLPAIKKNFDERSLKIRENLLQKTISHQMRGKNIKFLNLFEFIYTSFFFRRLFYFFKSFK